MKRSLWRIADSNLLALAVCGWMLSGCYGGNKPLTDEQAYKRFVGTWVNTEPQVSQPYVKVVLQPDNVVKFFVRMESESATARKVTVKKTLVDAEGGTCCQFFFVTFEASMGKGVKGLGLMRLDKARTVLEMNHKMGKEDDPYPDQIERKVPGENWSSYMIFYRK